jgi:outer membrane receptor protein involved in Fe transport
VHAPKQRRTRDGLDLSMDRRTDISRIAAGVALALLCATAGAQQEQGAAAQAPEEQAPQSSPPAQDQLEEIVVFGRSLQLLGRADAASEGTVGGADLAVRPMLRVAELLEAVPGLVAVQHSGSGKANQYFLRGFNLDHGTDFTAYVDGMPWNLRTHGHGQGYLDVNGMIPEVVERIDYRKGPYRADLGDFSMAGASFISTIDRLDAPFLGFEAGQYGWDRVAAGGTKELKNDALLTGLIEHKGYDGPWQEPEGLRHTALFGKYRRPTEFGNLAVTLWGYDAQWHPTEQIPERAIGTVACADEFCALDPTAIGDTSRWIGSAVLDGAKWRASAYVQYYDWQMTSNPTYDYQLHQFDRRTTIGGRYEHTVIDGDKLQLHVGGEFRYDDIGNVGLDHYDRGQYIENISDNSVREPSLAGFTEATWSPTDKLRLMGGVRSDLYDFDVVAKTTGSFAGHKSDSRTSPKVGIAWAPSKQIELYGNWGRGYHSNDARGVVNTTDPVPGLSPGTGYEAGARFEVGAIKLTAAHWWLDLDSELIFVGDSNAVEPKGASRRDGYELTLFWRPVDWLGIDAVYTGSTARYVDNPDGPYVEGAVEHSGEIGIQAVKDRWEASLRIRYLGPYALTADNAHRAASETTISVRGAYTVGRMMWYADLLNVPNSHGKDIVYWYEAYVPGLDPVGTSSADIDCNVTDCRVSRAQEPRTLRVGVKVKF